MSADTDRTMTDAITDLEEALVIAKDIKAVSFYLPTQKQVATTNDEESRRSTNSAQKDPDGLPSSSLLEKQKSRRGGGAAARPRRRHTVENSTSKDPDGLLSSSLLSLLVLEKQKRRRSSLHSNDEDSNGQASYSLPEKQICRRGSGVAGIEEESRRMTNSTTSKDPDGQSSSSDEESRRMTNSNQKQVSTSIDEEPPRMTNSTPKDPDGLPSSSLLEKQKNLRGGGPTFPRRRSQAADYSLGDRLLASDLRRFRRANSGESLMPRARVFVRRADRTFTCAEFEGVGVDGLSRFRVNEAGSFKAIPPARFSSHVLVPANGRRTQAVPTVSPPSSTKDRSIADGRRLGSLPIRKNRNRRHSTTTLSTAAVNGEDQSSGIYGRRSSSPQGVAEQHQPNGSSFHHRPRLPFDFDENDEFLQPPNHTSRTSSLFSSVQDTVTVASVQDMVTVASDPDQMLKVGDRVLYQGNGGKNLAPATIQDVYLDDNLCPYYYIRFQDGSERQTDNKHICFDC